MRRATHDVAWLIHDDGQTAGITLGYDFCAEHEFGVKEIRQAMGISGDKGVEGRTMTQQPPSVRFDTYKRTQRKKRGTRKDPAAEPAALLVVSAYDYRRYSNEPDPTVKELVKSACRDGLDFHAEPHDDWYKAERDNVASAWGKEGFAIHVRGQENVERLREIAESLKQNDIALADPGGMGFADRSGLGVIIASRLPQAIRDNTLAADLAQERLEQAAEATGIAKLLKAQGKGFYALSPAWKGEGEQEVHFFLNPMEQNKYNHGWYSVDDLQAWARNEGPILKEQTTPTAAPKRKGP